MLTWWAYGRTDETRPHRPIQPDQGHAPHSPRSPCSPVNGTTAAHPRPASPAVGALAPREQEHLVVRGAGWIAGLEAHGATHAQAGDRQARANRCSNHGVRLCVGEQEWGQ